MRLFSVCRFARFETMILSLPSFRFGINLQNFKKLLDIFSPQIERKRFKEYLVIILQNINLSFKLEDSGFLETL